MAKYWYYTYFPEESDLSDEEKLWIDRLNRIGIVFFRPLVAVALCKSNNETERISLLKQIERFIFLFFRLAYYRANYQSSVYYNFARDIYNGNKTITDVINSLEETTSSNIQYIFSYFYNAIEKKFSSGKNDGYYGWNSLRYFLYEYEFHLWKSTGVKKPSWELFSKIEKDKISIEHILPQTPSNWYWRNQFRQYTENPAEMIKLTGTLGNLLPLAQSINSSLQNDSFPDKRDSIGHRGRCYINGSNSENEVARDNMDWDAQRIYNRCVRLLNFMEQRWDIPMTQEQKAKLTFIDFVNDVRIVVPVEPPIE